MQEDITFKYTDIQDICTGQIHLQEDITFKYTDIQDKYAGQIHLQEDITLKYTNIYRTNILASACALFFNIQMYRTNTLACAYYF